MLEHTRRSLQAPGHTVQKDLSEISVAKALRLRRLRREFDALAASTFEAEGRFGDASVVCGQIPRRIVQSAELVLVISPADQSHAARPFEEGLHLNGKRL